VGVLGFLLLGFFRRFVVYFMCVVPLHFVICITLLIKKKNPVATSLGN
jgi:hypothetical protein